MMRRLVLSRTYRQSSRGIRTGNVAPIPTINILPGSRAIDLPAEMVRDNALSISGLLVSDVGGAASSRTNRPGTIGI